MTDLIIQFIIGWILMMLLGAGLYTIIVGAIIQANRKIREVKK